MRYVSFHCKNCKITHKDSEPCMYSRPSVLTTTLVEFCYYHEIMEGKTEQVWTLQPGHYDKRPIVVIDTRPEPQMSHDIEDISF